MEWPAATVWLIGMMGSGKSSVGRLLARNLGLEFIDCDVEIAERMGMSVADIFGHMGEDVFRDLESQVLADLAGCEAVIATGGGVVLRFENVEVMRVSGPIIWLSAPPEVLAHRVGDGKGRPLVTGDVTERLTRILDERRHLYEESATVVVETEGKGIGVVASEVQRWIESE